MMYKSPVEILTDRMSYEFERATCKAVLNVGIEVDPAELQKALLYDRDQYNKGFEDGFKKGMEHRRTAWWHCKDNKISCMVCEEDGPLAIRDFQRFTPYCPECGSRMLGVLHERDGVYEHEYFTQEKRDDDCVQVLESSEFIPGPGKEET